MSSVQLADTTAVRCHLFEAAEVLASVMQENTIESEPLESGSVTLRYDCNAVGLWNMLNVVADAVRTQKIVEAYTKGLGSATRQHGWTCTNRLTRMQHTPLRRFSL